MFKISSGLQYHLMATGSLITALADSVIKIYGSDVSLAAAQALIPATANAAVGSALLLCTVSVDGNGTGVTFDPTPINGAIYKNAIELWKGINVASGYPSFYRIQQVSDDGTLSTVNIRAQGSVGQIGTDLVIASAFMTQGQEQRVDSYTIGLPTE